MDTSLAEEPVEKVDDIELRLLLEAIYQHYHYDFRGYSMASIRRRMKQALKHFHCRSYSILQDKVLHEPEVMTAMLSFLTVQVSEMFRDPAYFRVIREKVVPLLRTYPSLKVWVAGCSSGEELYSLAILFREEGLEQRTLFYATDINTDALQKAERGIFPLDQVKLYTKNHQLSGGKTSLSDYYIAGENSVIFDKSLRKRMVFSDHSLATDAVFTEAHLISCRNVMIYFNRELQDHAIQLFKDSLIYKGFLGIGSKENIRFSAHAAEFREFDIAHRIYQKLGAA